MSVYRFISTPPEDSETEGYFVSTVNVKDRGKAQQMMANRLRADEEVVSIQINIDGRWEVIEGKGDIPGSELSLHPRSTPNIAWEGDSESASPETAERVRQPPKYSKDGKAPNVDTSAHDATATESPIVVHVLYFVTTIFLLGGILTLTQLPWGYMNFLAAATSVVTTLMPALVGWVVTVTISYLDRIHKNVEKMAQTRSAH